MYDQFASVYDRLMDDVDYPAWARHYLALIRRARGGEAPGTLCECGCGTGSMLVEFLRLGPRATGVDLSEAMLRLAAEKLRAAGLQAVLSRQDMAELLLPRPVDAVIAPCDGVNYLLSEARAKAFFARTFSLLKPGGVLAFDVSTRHKFHEMDRAGLFYEDRSDLTYFWRAALDGEIMRMELTFFVRQEGGRYRRFDERQAQRAHGADELAAWLTQCGFAQVQIYGGQTFDPPAADEARIHLCALRPRATKDESER